MRQFEIPKPLRDLTTMWQSLVYDGNEVRIHKICIGIGNDRVWVIASKDKDGDPILEFSSFNMSNPPLK